MSGKITIVLSLMIFVFLTGCDMYNCRRFTEDLSGRKIVIAKYTNKAVNVDGRLDDPQWETAESYTLVLPLDRQGKGMSLREDGQVSFCWDKDYLYVGIKFNDADVIATGQEDNIHHYKLGDLCEIFLKPINETYYWELYATPASRKTAFYFPTKLHQPIIIDNEFCDKMIVRSQITGTLNKSDDKDSGWTAEMAIPVKQLKKYGAQFKEGQFWTVLAGRYDYFNSIEAEPDLSAFPEISITSWHSLDEYAILKLEK
ncbi:MAG TPA: hypothetical protein DDW84_02040 [Phycisphaerales bacterium]|nr:hypothetical protein [Phycisphaerales bacterium]HBR19300.1 hypothetical protein [Phycisphaerales bacterium]